MALFSFFLQQWQSFFESPKDRLMKLVNVYHSTYQVSDVNLLEIERWIEKGITGRNRWQFWAKPVSPEDAWKELEYSAERAILGDNPSLLALYLKAGYPVDRPLSHNLRNNNLLLTTARSGSSSCLELLLQYQPNVLVLDADGKDIASLILREPFSDQEKTLSETTVFRMMELLLKHGFPVEGHPQAQASLLTKSLGLRNEEVCQLLLENHASICPQKPDDYALIHIWAHQGLGNTNTQTMSRLFDLLVKYGANPEELNDEGRTPLLAIAAFDGEMAHLMVNKGVSLKAKDAAGNNLAHLLALNYYYDSALVKIIRYRHPELLEEKNNLQQTPLDAVMEALGHPDLEPVQKHRLMQWKVQGQQQLLEQTTPIVQSKPTLSRRL